MDDSFKYPTGNASKMNLGDVEMKRDCSDEEKSQILKEMEEMERKEVNSLKDKLPELFEKMLNLKNSKEKSELVCPKTLSSEERKAAHSIAGALGLSHESKGKGKKRHLVVSNERGHKYCHEGN